MPVIRMGFSKAEKIARLQAMIDLVPPEGFGEVAVDKSPAKSARNRMRQDKESSEKHPTAKTAYSRIVELCGYHDFSRAKMRERLKREGIPDGAIEEAIERAVKVGLIDDLRWGEMRASALMRRGVGRNGVVRELKENGIDAYSIAGWPHEYEERFGSELDRATCFLEKNPPRSKNPRASAYGKLMRKGYSPDIAARACALWFDSRDSL